MRGNEVLLLDYIRRVSMPLTKNMSGILRCDVMIMHNNIIHVMYVHTCIKMFVTQY